MWWKIQKLLRLRPRQIQPTKDQIILITGCDSGFGFRAALEASKAGFTVIAGLLEGPTSDAAQKMLNLSPTTHQPHILKLDITNDESVSETVRYVSNLLETNPSYSLHSLVNNAGVMIFGELEWQTQKMVDLQVSVNITGTFRMTKAIMPLLRQSAKSKTELLPRLVVIGSHCGFQGLPFLSYYTATKHALRGWCETIRMELEPHKIHVVNFIPGSMVVNTDIATRQKLYNDDMRNAFDPEVAKYYSNHFEEVSSMLNQLSFPKPPDSLKDSEIMEKFMATLLDETPDPEYKQQPWRYAFYYNLIAMSPRRFKHWFVDKLIAMPKFKCIREKK